MVSFPLEWKHDTFAFPLQVAIQKYIVSFGKEIRKKKMVLNISYLITLQEKIILATIISLPIILVVISKIQK